MLEKDLVNVIKPVVEAVVSVEKDLDVLKQRIESLPEAHQGADGKDGRDGADGQDGIGIKSIEMSVDRKSMTLILDNDQTIDVELPEGERGERGEKGLDGADGLGINTKHWEAGIHREGTYVTHAIGKVYKAMRDTSSKPGSPD